MPAASAPRRAVGRRAQVRRAADALARMERAGRARDRAPLRARQDRHPAGRVAVLRALREGDQRAEEGARRRHPGAQLPDAGNLQLRRRLRRRLAAARASRRPRPRPPIIVQGGVHFMAETSKILNPDKTVLIPDCARAARSPPRSPARTCGCCASKFPGVPVVTYVNTSADVKAEVDICCTSSNAVQVVESLGADTRDLPARPVSGELRRLADQGEDHRLEGRVRGARALHRRRAATLSRGRSVGADHRASGMPARRARGGRLHRLDRGHDRLGAQEPARSAS